MKSLFLFVSLILCSETVAQWSQLPGPYGGAAYGFYEAETAIYATTYHRLFQSTDRARKSSVMKIGLPEKARFPRLLYKKGDLLILNVQPEGQNACNILRSEDGGKTFDTSFQGLGRPSLAIIGDTLYTTTAPLSGNGQLVRSIDHGKSWSTFSPPAMSTHFVASEGRHLYMITSTSPDDFQVRTSFDAGYSWDTLQGLPKSSSHVQYIPRLLYSQPRDADTVLWVAFESSGGGSYTSQSTLYVANSASDSLIDARLPVHAKPYTYEDIVRVIGSKNNKLYLNTSRNIFTHDGNTSSWTDISYNLPSYSALVNWGIHETYPLNDGELLVTLPFTQGIARLNPTSKQYETSDSGLTATSIGHLINFNDTLFASTRVQNQHLFYSTTHGETWLATNYMHSQYTDINALGESQQGLMIAGSGYINFFRNLGTRQSAYLSGYASEFERTGDTLFALSPTDCSVSTNEGKSWQQRTPVPLKSYSGQSIATSVDGRIFMAGDSLFSSTDGASSWQGVSTFPFPVERFVCLGAEGSRLFAGVIYEDKRPGFGIFMSSDYGETWKLISTQQSKDLSGYFVYPLNGIVLCGTGQGIFVCGYNGQRWSLTPIGNGNVRSITHDAEYVYVGTDQAGIWRASIADLVEEFADVKSHSARTEAPLVFPNPVRTTASLHADNYSHIAITDLLGRIVYRSERREQYDLSHLQPGIYSVAVYEDDRSLVVQQFIKQ